MKSIHDIAAPAKLNLFLHITGRRPDGYHLLQSAFMLIDWCDTLHIEGRADGLITREDLSIELPPDDLILRAARALQHASGTTLGAHIAIDKKIPAQAGMGGGSSDAASTLLALNRLWDTRLSAKHLSALGLQLGADVPFFLAGYNAWVEGIGELITPIHVPSERFLVVKPDQGLDTKSIFLDPSLKRDSERATILSFAADTFDVGRNDLQPVAQKLCPEIDEALQWISSQGLNGRMTGSGSAVFAKIPSNFELEFAPSNFQARICKSLVAHPLADWASS